MAGVRRGRGRELGREKNSLSQNSLSLPFQTPAVAAVSLIKAIVILFQCSEVLLY